MKAGPLPVLALAALLGGAAAAALPRPALAAEAEQAARPQIGRPVEAAQQLLKQRRLKEALAKLAEAEAVRCKTPYESYVIAATRAAVLQASGDYPGTIKALEAALATGVLPPAEAQSRLALLAELSYAAKDYAGTVAYGRRYYAAGGADAAPRRLMAQADYLRGDFAAAADACRALLAADDRAGKPTGEAVLQMLADSEYRQQHGAAYRAALTELAARYPTTANWRQLLAAVRQQPGFADRLALDLDRLMAATGTLATQAQYMEAAELALQAGLASEAKALLEQGYAAGVLSRGGDAARQQRLLALATRQAAEDLKDLPQRAKEAEAAHDGRLAAELGEAYAGYARWDEAIAALRQALRKGGLAHPDDAKLHLGIALVKAGRTGEGEAMLRSVAGGDGTGTLAQLWLLVVKTGAQAPR